MMFVSPDAGTMDDSMLDVDGRADVLDSLVQRVTDEQADTVGRVLSGEVGSENGLDLAGQGVSAAMVSREAEGSGDVISLMRRQMSVMEQLIKGSVAGLDGQDDSSGGIKRKVEKVSYHPQEPVHFDELYKVDDDAHDKVDTKLRQRLRPINADPKYYWKRGAFDRVDSPILGSTIFLEHIMPGTVNEATVCKRHDSHAHVEIKNFLSKNSGVGSAAKKQIKVHEVSDELFAMGVQQHWDNASSVFEVVDAGLNYMAVEHMIRPYSYSPIAIFRVLHESRFYCGVAIDAKQQRMLLEAFFNECFKKNQARAREGKHPVTYMEAMEISQRVLAANKVTSFSSFFSGDPYVGARSDEIKKKNAKISELELENKRLRDLLRRFVC